MGHGHSNIRGNRCKGNINSSAQLIESFNDLKEFPPEIALSILSKLNATDLCLASCVWQDLAEDEVLWKSLCFSRWAYTTMYEMMKETDDEPSKCVKKPMFKSLYLLLDEASLIYSFRPHQGVKYLIDNGVMRDDPTELAKLLHGASFYNRSTQLYLKDRSDVLEEFVKLQEFEDVTLCDSLRKFFGKVHPPEQRGEFLDLLVEKFANRFYECNPQCGFNIDSIAVLCYSLVLLSVDLYSPHVKNKMSKREFIRNNRQVLTDANRDTLSDLYDDVYMNGHIVPNFSKNGAKKEPPHRFPFYRPYGAIFEFKPIEMKLNCAC